MTMTAMIRHAAPQVPMIILRVVRSHLAEEILRFLQSLFFLRRRIGFSTRMHK